MSAAQWQEGAGGGLLVDGAQDGGWLNNTQLIASFPPCPCKTERECKIEKKKEFCHRPPPAIKHLRPKSVYNLLHSLLTLSKFTTEPHVQMRLSSFYFFSRSALLAVSVWYYYYFFNLHFLLLLSDSVLHLCPPVIIVAYCVRFWPF